MVKKKQAEEVKYEEPAAGVTIEVLKERKHLDTSDPRSPILNVGDAIVRIDGKVLPIRGELNVASVLVIHHYYQAIFGDIGGQGATVGETEEDQGADAG